MVNKVLLEIKNLSAECAKFALKNIFLSIKECEIVGLVGESGSGKTLLSYLILRLIHNYSIKGGSIEFLGRNLLNLKEKELQKLRGSEISYIFQEPLSALNPLHKIKKQLEEAILIHKPFLKKDAINKRIKELLNSVQLDSTLLERYPYELSGGQRQRVCIAIALANNPKLLIADEPTTALDSTTQEQIIMLLKQLQKEFNLSILFISHNLSVVSKLSQRIIVMQKGEIIEENTTKELFKNPKNAYTKMLLEALHFNYNVESFSKEVLLKAQNLSVKYPLKKSFFGKTLESFKAVESLNFTLHKGESLGIIGESGSGKSSLANALCGLLESKNISGSVEALGLELFALKDKELKAFRKNMQIVFQDPFSALNPKMNILEILLEGLFVHFRDLSKALKLKMAIRVLRDVGLNASFLKRYPNELSGGQRQRINIARSLILKPKILILDEPTSALDCATQKQILTLLLKLAKEYKLSYICISHDLSTIATLCQSVLVLKKGRILESGSTKEVFSAPKNAYVKELLDASFI
ncbi:MAG: dipeptide ABC transporter ATP-binding protein [Helicobacter sp.]|nr:dipeptide ABC transporter ATP-binding protein [Helicobacter sp.]